MQRKNSPAQEIHSKPPLKVEVSGSLLDDVSAITSALASFAVALLSSLSRIVEEATEMVIRFLRRH